MTIADHRGPATPAPPPDPHLVVRAEADERAQRETLRGQVARLERRLATASAQGRVAASRRPAITHGPRVLDLGDLERVRDDLVARVEITRRIEDDRVRTVAAHRGAVVTAADLDEPGCRRWCVRPVLGPLGRLSGWWRVRVSSGCP